MTQKSNTAIILGHPVAHSRSPIIHSFWLNLYGIEGAYITKDVSPDDINVFIGALTPQDCVGGNVTIPHKEAVYKFLQHHTPQALKLEAVNTLYWEEGKLIGHNTDGYGFISHLKASVSKKISTFENVLILGAGGAAKPIIAALIDEGVSAIKIANRTFARAEKLSAQFGSDKCQLDPICWDDISQHMISTDLLVNTTSLGMSGQPPLSIDFGLIPTSSIVYDIVYAPLETELLAAARAKGAHCVDGLGMLLHQAVPGFEKWFGKRPEVSEELRDLIVSDLEKSS